MTMSTLPPTEIEQINKALETTARNVENTSLELKVKDFN